MNKPSANSFPAIVDDDLTLSFVNGIRLKQFLLPLKTQTVTVTITHNKPTRSDDQNRYYWGVVIRYIADYAGYRGNEELQSLHEELKRKFLPKLGVLQIAQSTATLTSKEFSDYVETIRTWAATELSLYIPDANEQEA